MLDPKQNKTKKILEENIGSKISDITHRNFYWIHQPRQGKQKNSKQMGLHETKKCLHNKGNHQQNKNMTHWMRENIF